MRAFRFWAVLLPILGAFPGSAQDLEEAVAEQIRELEVRVYDLEKNEPATDLLGEAWAELGRLHHAYELWTEALDAYGRARTLLPDHAELAHLRADVVCHLRDGKACVEAWELALKLEPEDFAGWIRLARARIEIGRPEEAAAALERAAEIQPEAPSLLSTRGDLLSVQGDHRGAIRAFEEALAAAPAANRLHYPLATAYRALGEHEKAREHLASRGEVGLVPPDPALERLEQLRVGERVHQLRGRLAFKAGRYEEAAELFALAVEADPQSARSRVNLATSLASLGRTEEARQQFEAALEIDPTMQSARFNLATLALQGGDHERSAGLFADLLAADADDQEARRFLAVSLRALGRTEEALTQLRDLHERAPGDENAILDLTGVLVDLQRYTEALAVLEEGREVLPGSGLILHRLAKVLAAVPDLGLRDGERAVELAATVFQARPTLAHAETLALALAEAGRCDEAAALQEKVLSDLDDASEPAASTVGPGRRAQLEANLRHYQDSRPCRP